MSPRTSSRATPSQVSSNNSIPRPSFRHLMEIGFGAVIAALLMLNSLLSSAFAIIRYRFRYNQRSREAQALNENGDQVDLSRMQQPHSQGREEKLMTMEELRARFPLTKYKDWKSLRHEEGLPVGSCVKMPTSQTASEKDRECTTSSAEEGGMEKRQFVYSASSLIAIKIARQDHANADSAGRPKTTDITGDASDAEKGLVDCTEMRITQSLVNDRSKLVATVGDDGDEVPICDVTSREMLAICGDCCTICLDPLEDDDNVRGLTCGHAFHATCVDPWLTSRRVCCPLCRTDYLISKPQPDRRQFVNLPQRPPLAWLSTSDATPVPP